MPKRGDAILLDTMIIIEAHRVKVWNAIVDAFNLETVEKVIEEVGTGDYLNPNYIKIDQSAARKNMTVHAVTQRELAELQLKCRNAGKIDEGEKYLLAHAIQRKDLWLLCSSDKAALRTVHEARCLNRCISLESAMRLVGEKKKLKINYTEKWLKSVKADIKMDAL